MENPSGTKQKINGTDSILKQKNSILTHHIDSFLEECRVQKRFFSGQMPIEEYIGIKKKYKK